MRIARRQPFTAPSKKALWIVGGGVALLLLSLPWILAPDSQTHGSWQQFFGRFHPLAVHLPIGLLLLVPVLEIGDRFRSGLREAAGVVLGCAAVCSVGSVLLGMLLAHGGGFAPESVRGHMWAGLILTLLVIFCMLIRPSWAAGRNARLYPLSLGAVVLLTTWTAHQGGALTYGRSYLTEFAPAFVKQFGVEKTYPPVDPASVYATKIQPILNAKCVSCHGPAKVKGGLQLDSYAHLMDGGNVGDIVSAGHAENSVLLHRVTLPASDSKFMPSEGKPPLTAKEIEWIKAWIQQGASPAATTPTGMENRTDVDNAVSQVGDYSRYVPQIGQIKGR